MPRFCIVKPKDGGDGGHGGPAGNGGNGGTGGRGGDIWIVGPQQVLDLSLSFEVFNEGGDPGQGGTAGPRGAGGRGGKAGQRPTSCPGASPGKSRGKGPAGKDGDDSTDVGMFGVIRTVLYDPGP